MALRHLETGYQRPAGKPLVEVFNPEGNGLSSPHTVVTIVTDDMPFLVDSLGAKLLVGWLTATVASIAGLYASYALDLPTGAAIVCTLGAALILTIAASLLRGAETG